MDFIKFANQVLQELANKQESYKNNLLNNNFENPRLADRAAGILYGIVSAETVIREVAQRFKDGTATAADVHVQTQLVDQFNSNSAATPDMSSVAEKTVELAND